MKSRVRAVFQWLRSHRLRLGVLVLVLALLMPSRTQSQVLSPCCTILAAGLTQIANTISNVVGAGLQAINSVLTAIDNFQRTIVWPQQAINQARAVVGSIRGIYSQIRSISQIAVSSATLVNPQRLEQTLLSRNPNLISQAGADYLAVYRPLPTATDAPPEVRDLIDMTDAAAQAAMKRAIAIDALAELELQAADRINQEIQNAAPGSAPIIEAGAAAWLVRANAYTQGALADLMRVRAIDLANAGAELKLGATQSSEVRRKVTDILKRR